LTAALCRIFLKEGFRVAPFKAQNMALNSAATPEGLEIGRAQAVQAEAAGIPPTVDMNPVLIKPSTDTSSQVIFRGRVWDQVSASDYHRRRIKELFPVVVECYRRLAAVYDIIVLEGAGSPAEINLRAGDIVNMRMAEAAGAACLLVGDIDRGGVFAALLGTLELIEEKERARIRGFIINKFRGDYSLLEPGVRFIEQRLQKPCLGVVPYLSDIGIEEEDGVAMEDRRPVDRVWSNDRDSHRPLRVGVIALPHLANFTDFDALASEPSVAIAFVTRAGDLALADVVIVPGSKQTIHDLAWLRREGFVAAIETHVREAGLTVGICGGMQMLGKEVLDPENMEGGGHVAGLGLLPIRTVLAREKVTVRARAVLTTPRLFGREMTDARPNGYEIHLGQTRYTNEAVPLFSIVREGSEEELADGACSEDERTIGTYLHGLLDSDPFRHAFLRAARAARQLEPPRSFSHFSAEREARFDRLAEHVRRAIKLETLFEWLGLEPVGSN
jgi:adenosylcobyric acid synthase